MKLYAHIRFIQENFLFRVGFLFLLILIPLTIAEAQSAGRMPAGASVQNPPTGTTAQTNASIYLPLVMKSFPFVPEAPVLHTINNDDGDGNYTISWSPSEGANTYTLQEDTQTDFASPTTVYSGPNTSTEIRARDVGTYLYRIQAANLSASSGWSNIESVVVTVPTPTNTWMITTIPGQTIQGAYSDIALGPQENPHINYLDASDLAVKYSHWSGNNWETDTVDTLELLAYPSTALALKESGEPQIAYAWNNPCRLGYADWNGTE